MKKTLIIGTLMLMAISTVNANDAENSRVCKELYKVIIADSDAGANGLLEKYKKYNCKCVINVKELEVKKNEK